ncbi:bidirectional sugar transporter SWEET1a-like [Capsicum annuum]
MAPMITFKRIIRKRSTEQFSSIPYVIALLNCLLSVWRWPGGNLCVDFPNICTQEREGQNLWIPPCGPVHLLMPGLGFPASIRGYKRKLLCGFAFTVSCIMMYGSPLSVMRLVIKSKSVEYLSLSVFICSILWSIFALLGKDPFILVPNGIGTLLGAVQLILYAIYRDNRREVKKDEMNESVEKRTGEIQDKKLANT